MLIFMVFPAASAVFMGDGLVEAIFAILLPPVGYILPDLELKAEIKKRKNSILRDFPVFCTDLAIMSSAGLDIVKAWEIAVAAGKKSEFYREAGLAVLRNRSGIGMIEAIDMFSTKLAVPEVHTFASVVTQALKEGGDMSSMLEECAKRSWRTREAEAGRKAEEASARIVFPLVLGLMGILLMLAAPAVLMMKGV
jgi:tight adherence protein C